MKIVVISNLYPPMIRGGAEIIAAKIAEGLQKNLQHVSVITSAPEARFFKHNTEHIIVNGIAVTRLYPWNVYPYFLSDNFIFPIRMLWHLIDLFNVHSYLRIRSILRSERPDIVITHNLMGLGLLLPRLIKKCGIFHVHILHDVQLVNPTGLIIKGREQTLLQRCADILGYSAILRSRFRGVSIVISPSNFLLDFYQQHKFFKNVPTYTLKNPVDIPDNVRHKRVHVSRLRLLYLGQIHPAKGVYQLVSVVHKSHHQDIELKVVGAGESLKHLMSTHADDPRIRYYGWRTREEIIKIFFDTDVLVVPTLCYDNSPTVVYEALSFGLPVLCSDIGGAKELVSEGINGWLFEAGNESDLHQKIERLRTHPDLVSAAAAQAQKSVKHLSTDSYIVALLDIIDRHRPQQSESQRP